MTFGKIAKAATDLLNGVLGGWADAYRVAKCSADGARSVLVNSHGQTLDFWEGLGWWWVETHELSVERDTAKNMEDLFGNSNSSSCVDSDSITFGSGPNQVVSVFNNGGVGLGTFTPSIALTVDQVTGSGYNVNEWLDSLDNSALRITAPRATGRWDYERVSLETTNPPNPIRRALIASLTGAKWTPYSSKHETKYYGYLRLMHNPAYLTRKILSTN